MENENIIEEQPIAGQATVLNKTDEASADRHVGSSQEGIEEDLGKFKSSRALLEAYNSLQAEFTKKCQKLSELEKEKTIEKTPEKYNERLEAFLASNRDAGEYREEFQSFLDSQNEPVGSIDGAWAKFVLAKLSSNEEAYFDEPIAKKYIFQNENVRNKIIHRLSSI